jgi:hypothetical protein
LKNLKRKYSLEDIDVTGEQYENEFPRNKLAGCGLDSLSLSLSGSCELSIEHSGSIKKWGIS